jgi:hypothetical protein
VCSSDLALEQLGFAPCHHMAEVFADAQRQIPLWNEAGAGRPDWDAIFDGFQAMVDHPGCGYWRELMDYYPDAKVLHTVRDPDKWFDSTQATIFSPENLGRFREGPMATFFGHLKAFYENGDMNDRGFMTDFFRRHTERVVAAVPADRLLVFNVTEGWEPLCRFLGVPVPATPYPRENSTEQFQARAATGGPPIDPAKMRATPAG